jgi:hypothetical protein
MKYKKLPPNKSPEPTAVGACRSAVAVQYVVGANSLVMMAVGSMLRRANRAQAGIQRLYDQALVGAGFSRVGIQLGLLALSKPDDDTGKFSG